MQYTRQGWIHETKNTTPYLLIRPDAKGKKCVYELDLSTPDDTDSCCLPRRGREAKDTPPTFLECLLLLANISLGQRLTTPQGQNKFIDRYSKTFFRPSNPIKYGFSQTTVSDMGSLANYVHARRWDEEYGVIESIYEEYLFICGNIAYSLYDAAKRYSKNADEELTYAVNSKKHALYLQEADKKECTKIARYACTPEHAAALVEGAMIAGVIRDRTTIAKDKSNIKLQATLACYKSVKSPDVIKMMKAGNLVCKELFDYFASLASAATVEFWIIGRGDDFAMKFPDYDDARWTKCGGRKGFTKVKGSPAKNSGGKCKSNNDNNNRSASKATSKAKTSKTSGAEKGRA